MTEPRTGFAIFCDDVRQETNGKFIFIGVYGTEMIFQGSGPFVVQRLVIPIWIRTDVDNQFSQVGIVVTGPGPEGKLLTFSEAKIGKIEREEGMKFQLFQTTLATSTFVIARPQTLEVIATVDGEELTCARLHVRFTPLPVPSQPSV